MRDIGEGTVRRIDWQELTPVVRLLRIFSVAMDFRILFLSMTGIMLTLISGYMINTLRAPATPRAVEYFVETIDLDDAAAEPVIRTDGPGVPKSFSEPVYIEPLVDFQGVQLQKNEPISFREQPGRYVWDLARRSVFVPWDVFSMAGLRLFSLEPVRSQSGVKSAIKVATNGSGELQTNSEFGLKMADWTERGIAAFWFVLLVFIWTIPGGMICRTAALRLTIDQAESSTDLWRFMKDRGTGYLSSLTILIPGILICALFIMLGGFLFSLPGVNWLVGLAFPVVLLFAFLAILMAFGLLVGWPLLFAAVSVDGSDGFDAISRTYSYIYNRPLHYFLYWTVAGIIGMLGFVFVSLFVDGMVYLGITLGGFPAKAALPSFGHLAIPDATSGLDFPTTLVLIWCALAQLVKTAFAFGWFWTSGVTIYLLLRRSVDGTPFSDVLRLGPMAAEPRILPDVKLDEKGAPEIVKS